MTSPVDTIFNSCSSLKTITANNVTLPPDSSKLFIGVAKLQTIAGINTWDTSNVTNMARLFDGCNALQSTDQKPLDLSSWNTSNVTDMNAMFHDCIALTYLKFSGSSFKTNNVTDFSSMFLGCTNLETLDISTFNTSKAELMSSMFNTCSSLRTLKVGTGWSSTNATSKPTFGKAMTKTGTTTKYAEGDTIPNGSATYRA